MSASAAAAPRSASVSAPAAAAAALMAEGAGPASVVMPVSSVGTGSTPLPCVQPASGGVAEVEVHR